MDEDRKVNIPTHSTIIIANTEIGLMTLVS